MAKKKKTRYSSRFGARYGVSVKKRFDNVEDRQRQLHECPNCGFKRVKRVSTGIFECTKCSYKYAGGAFYPKTLTGGIIAKMVTQKAFAAQMNKELQEKIIANAREHELSQERKEKKIANKKKKDEKKEKREAKEAEDSAEEVKENPEEIEEAEEIKVSKEAEKPEVKESAV
jgi:large subunit ribosomal protein L37Ae